MWKITGGAPPVFPVLALVVVAVNLPQSVVVPVLPGVQADYGTDPVTATWLITGFLLASGVATPLLGRLGDAFGPRRVLVWVLLVLAVGCVGAALAPSVGWAIAARVVQGTSGGAVPLAFSALRREVSEERLGYAVAVLATVGSVAFSVGIVAAGPLLDAWGRAAVFLLPGVVALVAVAGVVLVLPDRRDERVASGRFGVLPVVLFSLALVGLLLAISQSARRGWTSPVVLALCGTALVAGLAWADRERRAAVPFVDLAMMRVRGVWTANLVAVLAGVGLFGVAAGLPQLLQAPRADGGLAAGLDEVGLLMAPISVAAFVTSLCTGLLYRRFALRTLVLVGTLLSGASMAATAVWHHHPVQLLAWNAVQGVGNGLVLSAVAGVVVAAVPASQTGVANGMNTNLRTVGGSLGTAVVAAVYSAAAVDGRLTETGFVAAFVVLTGAMAVSALAALLLPGPTRPRGPQDTEVGSDLPLRA